MCTTRSAWAATSGSCVMSTMVLPASRRRLNVFSTMSPVAVSRLPVGSSARMSAGSFTRARAMATRCIWPPDSSLLRWSYSRSSSDTLRSAAWARSSRSLRGQAV